MSIGREQLENDLKKAGICTGDLLVVHSSLKSLGYVEGGALTVIEALRNVVGTEGVVMFPCLTYPGLITEFLREIDLVDLRDVQIFTGAIPQAAWEHNDSLRSFHPTHPVAGFGNKVRELFVDQQSGQGPCGTDSPFYRAAMADAKILMIGIDINPCTIIHCVEEIAAPYIFSGDYFDVSTIDFDGAIHDVAVKGYCVGVARDFTKLEPELLDAGAMQIHTLGQADLRVIDAKKMVTLGLEGLTKNPELLLVKVDNE